MEQVPDFHTSENSHDWSGTHKSTLPCADCEGIQTEVDLRDDTTYIIKRICLSKDETAFEETGNFQWTEDGSTVVLTNKKYKNITLFKVAKII